MIIDLTQLQDWLERKVTLMKEHKPHENPDQAPRLIKRQRNYNYRNDSAPRQRVQIKVNRKKKNLSHI